MLSFKYYKNVNSLAKLIDGNLVSKQIKENLIVEVFKYKQLYNKTPVLAILQVGDRQDSNVYIRMKLKSAEEVGINAQLMKLPKNITEAQLLSNINKLNNDSDIHGIILQLPIDSSNSIDTDHVLAQISIDKDVDGLHPFNNGQLSHGVTKDVFLPCTPNGCIHLIKSTGCDIEGKRAVVIGRSRIVGGPMAQLLIWNNATVTVCHSRTRDIPDIVRQADILVAALGKPEFVKGDWIKPGAIVIDCGINPIPDDTKKSGYRLVGDVDIEEVAQVASWITPVPGGVGPMTVCMLLKNTIDGAFRYAQKYYDKDNTLDESLIDISGDSIPIHKLNIEETIANGGDCEIKSAQ
ncbi:unnamed protein product [Gordionus sp. m RMFG-2023]|uniref:uncharacterized protein LOC135926187 n=1 Tax=Gordionus sp. m RMFG-2023 TaxID=3053472 RepID=UPI0030E5AC97